MAEIVVGILILLIATGIGLTLRTIGKKWNQPMLKTFGLVVILVAVIVVVSLSIMQ